ncbi:MAG: hypothetical protein H8M99_07175 [Gloeobacteraceae cyanobacterium ES-bin-144]|nr:hypothetical protein [Verrucomicrobiales bacterium]
MFRLILFFSLFPIAIALAARWWFGIRILTSDGKRTCRCDLNRWLPLPGDDAIVHRAEESASEFGRQLRLKAMAKWKADQPKSANSRESSRRFGSIVPPLSGVIAVMAVLVGRVPIIGAVAILFGATALSAVMGLLSLPAELTIISRAALKAREDKLFPNRDDEDAVIRCAIAHAWEASLPSILRLIHR